MILKNNKKMETQLPMPFIQNIFAICWFYLAQQQSSFLSF